MYIKIEDNILKEWADWEFEGSSFINIDYSNFESEKYEVQNGELINISLTDEYLARKQEEFKLMQAESLMSEIDQLDEQRIRAMCEPSVKDESTNQTWLDYYNELIAQKRLELKSL